MSTILDYYKYAQLATAAYVRVGTEPLTGKRFAEVARDQERLPLSIGRALFDTDFALTGLIQWQILHYYGGDNTSDPIAAADTTGFGATLFQQGNERVLALRGTEPGEDVGIDLWGADIAEIGLLGMAFSQTVSMVNLIYRLKTPEGQNAQQVKAVTSLEPPSDPLVNYVAVDGTRIVIDEFGVPVVEAVTVYVSLISAEPAEGLDAIKAGETISVTGHSLGGHLAILAARLFPELVDSEVTVFNSPGFDPGTASFPLVPASTALDDLTDSLGEAAGNINPQAHQLTNKFVGLFKSTITLNALDSFAELNIVSLESEDLAPGDDPSFVSSFITNQEVIGESMFVATEPNSHVIEPFMDALALQAVIASMNSGLSLDDMRDLVLAASNTESYSEESVTDALFKLFIPDGKYLSRYENGQPKYEDDGLEESNALGLIQEREWIGKGSISARDGFHDAVLRIQSAVNQGGGNYFLTSLADETETTISNLASGATALGFRYALKTLNPFAVVGDNSIYAPHNQNGELDLYDPQTGLGEVTQYWLDDRAKMLEWKNKVYADDSATEVRGTLYHPGTIPVLFEDRNTGFRLNTYEKPLPDASDQADREEQLKQYKFGRDDNINTELVRGGRFEDRLYGGGGVDHLLGLAGNDYLEGGSGDDSLSGGEDNDTLVGGKGTDALYGGLGNDTYIRRPGDGFDRVIDHVGSAGDGDGVGRLVVVDANGMEKDLSGDKQASTTGNRGWAEDDEFLYVFDGRIDGSSPQGRGALLVVNKTSGELLFRVEGFANGELGLNLVVPSITRTTYFGTAGADTNASLGIPSGGGPKSIFAGEGNDVITNGQFDDQLYGEGGNDTLIATVGDDEVYGGPGDDTLEGGTGNDYLDGGDGIDVARGGEGNDVLYGGEGFDILSGDAFDTPDELQGNDYLDGEGGDDLLIGGGGADYIVGGAGNDRLDGDASDVAAPYHGNDILEGGPGADILIGSGGADVLDGGVGDDELYGDVDGIDLQYHGDDWLNGGDGSDLMFGGGANDTLFGGDGSDLMSGGGANDTLFGGGGADYISGDSANLPGALQGDDYLDGEGGNDVLVGGGGKDTIFGGADDDVIGGDGDDVDIAFHGDDYLDGEDGNDHLYGSGGADELFGGADKDILEGGAGNDYLEGGTGDDTLAGGAGDDTYFFGTGDGADTLSDESGDDTLLLGAGIALADVSLAGNAIGQFQNLVMTFGSSGDSIAFLGGTGGIEHFEFGDGTSLSLQDLVQATGGASLNGSDADDTLSSIGLFSFLDGGAGNDALLGGTGGTTYRFDLGDGADFINDAGGLDTIAFGQGIGSNDISWRYDASQPGGRFTLQVGTGGDEIAIANGQRGEIERFRFADGSTLSFDTLLSRQGGLPTALAPTGLIFNGGREDYVNYVTGSEGPDFIFDFDQGDVTYVAGRGDDYLEIYQGEGYRYVFNIGDGRDVINADNGSGETIVFGPGVTPDSVRFALTTQSYRDYDKYAGDPFPLKTREGLSISYGDRGDSVFVVGSYAFSSRYEIESFEFADGQTFSYAELLKLTHPGPLTAINQTNDVTLTGGDDVYAVYADSNGTRIGSQGEDVSALGGNDLVIGGGGHDFFDGGGGHDILQGGAGEDELYADGSYTDFANDLLDGGDGFDCIDSSLGNDLLIGGTGDDLIYGDVGNDVILFNRGDGRDEVATYYSEIVAPELRGDTLSLGGGIGYADLALSARNGDLILETGQGEFINLYSWYYEDVDDRTLSKLQLIVGASSDYDPNAVDPLLTQRVQVFDFAEIARQFDVALAQTPSMARWFIAGALASSSLGVADDAAYGGDLAYVYGTTGGYGHLPRTQVTATLADATFGGLQSFSAEMLAEIASPTPGPLSFNLGSGARTIANPTLLSTLRVEAGISAADITVTRDGVDLRITHSNLTDEVRVQDWYANGNGQFMQMRFDDGSLITPRALSEAGLSVTAPDSGGNLTGLWNQPNTLLGGAGSDVITGGVADDFISGGAGNDTLSGGSGHDTYQFKLGDGVDTINDVARPGAGNSIAFGAGISYSSSFSLGVGSLLLRVGDQGDEIHLTQFDQFDVYGPRTVENFIFADGTTLGYEELLARGFDLFGTAGDDVITGTNITDRIDGLAGNDTLLGGAGSDTYLFGPSSGQDVIREAAATGDVDTLQVLANPADVIVTREDNDIVVNLTGTTDRVAIDWFTDPGARIEQVSFADGTIWDGAALEARIQSQVNQAPVVANAIADQTTDEDSVFNFVVPADTFEDGDVGDTLKYSATLANDIALPAWLSFDAATRSFSGTPTNDEVGTVSVRVTATDGGSLSVSDDFDLSVANTNDAPVVANALADQSTSEDAPFDYQVPIDAFADIDVGDTLNYSATLTDDSAIPTWLNFDAATRSFTGTPQNADVGSIDVKVTATDLSAVSASDVFTLDVANTNDAPVVANALVDQSAIEDALFDYQVPIDAFADIDVGDTLNYAATLSDGSALPGWLDFDAATRSFRGTPTNDDVGTFIVRVSATDSGDLSVSDDFDIAVANTNDAPTLANAIADQTATEDIAFDFTVQANAFADVDVGDALAYGATLDDGSALPTWLSFDAAALGFSGTPTNDDVGTLSVRVSATDDGDLSVTDDFNIAVANTNDAPTLANAIGDQAATEDAAFSFTVQADAFADIDVGDTLGYTAELADGNALPDWLSFDISTRSFSGTPENADVGVLDVRVIATDVAGASDSDVFALSIANVNDAPVAYPDAVRVAEGASTGNLVAALVANDTDVDVGDNHTISAVDTLATQGTVIFDWSTQSLDYSAAGAGFDALGIGATATDAFNYTVSDTAGATSTATVNVTVDGVNDAPVLTRDIADQAALEDNPFSFQVPVDSFSDVDSGDVLTYGAGLSDGSALPAWLSFDATSLTFSGMPVYANAGTIVVGVTATDRAGLNASALFDLSVNLYPDLVLIGDAHDNTLTGHSGNDYLDGGPGADTMIGAHGDDTYIVDKSGDVIIEHANEGTDTVQTAYSYELGANLENLTLVGKKKKLKATGNAADNVLTGNDKDNTLIGLAGDDWLDGGGGHDKMYGGLGDDTYVVDDKKDKIKEKANEGIDTVRSSVKWKLDKNLENLVLLGTKSIDGKGNALDNLLVGNSAGNKLSGESGTDIIQGLGGKDKLKNKSGAGLLDGGTGEDKLDGDKGNELFIGGPGDDKLSTGSGADIIAFNRGDGHDSVKSKSKGGADDTLSLGGGIGYADLSLTRQRKDLVLNAGVGDSISFDDWYSKSGPSVINLQVVAEAMAEFEAGSSDPSRNQTVQRFDFAAIVSGFDAAGQVDNWSLTNALLDAHLAGSDSEAMGGDLAYQYGANGTLAGIGASAAQDVLNAPQFGSSTQTLRPLDDLQQGPNRLS